MDRELRENVKKLERGAELRDEERMRGGQAASGLLLGEEIEENQKFVGRLQSQLRLWNIVTAFGVLLLLIVLLYVLIAAVMKPTAPDPVPVPPPVEEKLVQTVSEVSLDYSLAVPDVSLPQLGQTTLDELVAGLEGNDFVDYLGRLYYAGDQVPSGVALYSMSSLGELVDGSRRAYLLGVGSQPDKAVKDFVDIGCSVHNFVMADGVYHEVPSDFYFNAETIGFGGLDDDSLASYISQSEETISIVVYDGTDAEPLVKECLEGIAYGDDRGDLASCVIQALSGVEFSLEYGEFSYSTCGDVFEEDGYIKYVKGGETYVPESVTRYEVSVTDYDFNIWVLSAGLAE